MAFWNRKKEPAATNTPSPQSSGPRSPVQSGIRGVKNVIAIASGKGGVGKSTVAVNLAVALSHRGAKVGLLDADIYGPSQPGMLGVASGKQPKVSASGQLVPEQSHSIRFVSMGLMVEDTKAVVWRAPIAMKMIQQFLGNVDWGELDFLLVDLPPGTGDVQLTIAQQSSLAGAIIVSTPQNVALGIARKGLTMFQQVNVPIFGIIENMSGFTCSHCGKETSVFKSGGAAAMAEELGVGYLGKVPLDPEIMMSGEEGIPLLIRAPDSPVAQAYLAIADELNKKIGELAGSSNEPEVIELTSDGGMKIAWGEGIETKYDAYQLRVSCACAVCVDENSGKRILNTKTVPLDIKVQGLRKVGRYAVSPTFSDGHSTGIYTFKKLKAMADTQQNADTFSV